MRYFLDTNIILGFIRRNVVAQAVAKILRLTDDNEIYVSVVSEGEIWSIARQSNWGVSRRNNLLNLLAEYQRADINDDELIQRYADIDAFSQNKLTDRPLGVSARNMGKNDLWIAASTSLAGASLIKRIKISTTYMVNLLT
ncbi:type II toxin-antitoxin system VapC family toxin [Spirosoma sp. SC4-14]|uniref:type II toxin-antitoxin system VapC family toxin n=1 Tax=Spirosoma sp. SC4-14 TaxID=3128900 RepID=UPI0030CE8121